MGYYDHNQNRVGEGSNSNDRVDIIAPGRRIVTTSLQDDDWQGVRGWTIATGSSIAAPFTSGAAALIISKFEKQLGRRLTISEIKYELFKRTNDMKYDRRLQGQGYIDLSIDSDNFGLPKYVQMWHPVKKVLSTVSKGIVDKRLKDGWVLEVPNFHERQKDDR